MVSKSCLVQVRLSPADAQRLDEICAVRRRTRSDLLREVVIQFCNTEAGGVRGGVPLTLPKKDRSLEKASRTKKETTSAVLQNCNTPPQRITPYLRAWTARFGGKANVGMFSRYILPLDTEHGPEKTLRNFTNFLAANDARYVSLPRFVQTFGSWDSVPRNGMPDINPGETVDQYAARLAAM